jgi:hypothetical protein
MPQERSVVASVMRYSLTPRFFATTLSTPMRMKKKGTARAM